MRPTGIACALQTDWIRGEGLNGFKAVLQAASRHASRTSDERKMCAVVPHLLPKGGSGAAPLLDTPAIMTRFMTRARSAHDHSCIMPTWSRWITRRAWRLRSPPAPNHDERAPFDRARGSVLAPLPMKPRLSIHSFLSLAPCISLPVAAAFPKLLAPFERSPSAELVFLILPSRRGSA